MEQSLPQSPQQPTQPILPPVMDPHANTSFLSRYKLTLITLFIVLLAALPLLFLARTTAKPVPTPVAQTPSITPTPTTEPLTPNNADAVLGAADLQLQTVLTQTDADVQASQVDPNQDTTIGL